MSSSLNAILSVTERGFLEPFRDILGPCLLSALAQKNQEMLWEL